MDYAAKDTRVLAEQGFFLQLKDPYTGEPHVSDNGEPSGFFIMGAVSPTVQRNLGELYAKSKKLNKELDDKRKRAEEEGRELDEDESSAILEKLHQDSIDNALLYILHGVEMAYGGQDVGSNKNLIRKVLNASFPQFRTNGKGELEPINTPYTKQVIDAAEGFGAFLDK